LLTTGIETSIGFEIAMLAETALIRRPDNAERMKSDLAKRKIVGLGQVLFFNAPWNRAKRTGLNRPKNGLKFAQDMMALTGR